MNSSAEGFSPVQYEPRNNKVFVALLFMLFILPWPYGGEIVWQYLAFSALSFTLLACYLLTSNMKSNTEKLSKIKFPFFILMTWLVYLFIQVIPLPHEIINLISQTRLVTPQSSNLIIENHTNPNYITLSVSPVTTLIEIIKYSSYISLFLLAFLLLNTKKRIIQLTTTLFVTSAIIAVYSLINYYSAGAINLFTSLPPWDTYTAKIIHGTLSYKNHYAAFLLLTIPLGASLIYYNIKPRDKNKLINFILSEKFIYLFLSLIMIVVLILNSSRAGNGAFLITSLLMMLFIIILKRRTISGKKIILFFITTVILLFLLILSGVGDTLISRYEKSTDNGRLHLINTALNITKDYPFVGSGAGTFPVIHKQYRTSELNGSIMWQRAHNDYLELLSTQGIIGFGLLAIALMFLYFRLFLNIKSIKSPNKLYGIQVACLTSITGILLHSIADFNFQLPVNAVYFFIIIALGLSAKELDNKKPKQHKAI